jgi:hypothetical protein
MHIYYPSIVNLRQEPSYVLIGGSRIISHDPSEVWHPKPVWIQKGIKVVKIWFLVRSCSPFGCEPELPQGSGNLFPDSISHSLTYVIPYHQCMRCWCPWKEHIGNRPVRHTATRRWNIRSISHRLIEWLLHVQVFPRARLTHIGKNPLITLARRAPPGLPAFGDPSSRFP